VEFKKEKEMIDNWYVLNYLKRLSEKIDKEKEKIIALFIDWQAPY